MTSTDRVGGDGSAPGDDPGDAVARVPAAISTWSLDRSRLGPGPCADCRLAKETADVDGKRVCPGCLYVRVLSGRPGATRTAAAQRALAAVGFLFARPLVDRGDNPSAPGAIRVRALDGWPLGERWRGRAVEAVLAPLPPPEPPAGDEPAAPLVVAVPWLPASHDGPMIVWSLTVSEPMSDGPRVTWRWHPSGGWGPEEVARLGGAGDWKVAKALSRLGPAAPKAGRRTGSSDWSEAGLRAAIPPAIAAAAARKGKRPTHLDVAGELEIPPASFDRYVTDFGLRVWFNQLLRGN